MTSLTPLQFAIQTAQEAGKIVLSFSGQALHKKIKASPTDFVTDADLASERYILDQITAAFPDDSILCEESGMHERNTEYTWIVDPLDGTFNFSEGRDTYGVMIARAHHTEIEIAVIYFPVQQITLSAEKGNGAYNNGERINRTFPTQVENIKACIGRPHSLFVVPQAEHLRAQFDAMQIETSTLRSAAANALSLVIGTKDIYVIQQDRSWDIAPTQLILSEAGFQVTDWENHPFDWTAAPRHNMLVAPPALHAEILALLQR